MGQENFLHHAVQSRDGAIQNHAGRERIPHPSTPPYPAYSPPPHPTPLPSHIKGVKVEEKFQTHFAQISIGISMEDLLISLTES